MAFAIACNNSKHTDAQSLEQKELQSCRLLGELVEA